MCVNLSCEVPSKEYVSSSVQTVENSYEIEETQTSCFDVLSYSCFHCEKSTNSESELNSHRREHHERFLDETNLVLECEICKAVCRDSRDLKMHIDNYHGWKIPHPEMKLYWCDVCLTNFERERCLKSHKRNYHQNFS